MLVGIGQTYYWNGAGGGPVPMKPRAPMLRHMLSVILSAGTTAASALLGRSILFFLSIHAALKRPLTPRSLFTPPFPRSL